MIHIMFKDEILPTQYPSGGEGDATGQGDPEGWGAGSSDLYFLPRTWVGWGSGNGYGHTRGFGVGKGASTGFGGESGGGFGGE